MRLFVAVRLSDEMRASIEKLIEDLRKKGVKGKYTLPENLHLTLCFIGESEEQDKIEKALSRINCSPFRLSTGEMGSFGDLLWLGADGGGALESVALQVRKNLAQEGISYDRKKFRPHITLIRKAKGNWSEQSAPKGEMQVFRISLMKSERIDGKMVYTEIYEKHLKAY